MKKLVMMVVMSGMVLECFGCWRGRFIIGSKESSSEEFFINQAKLYYAVEIGNLTRIKELLQQGAKNYCRNIRYEYVDVGYDGHFESRFWNKNPCDSPSDRAIELNNIEIANTITEAEKEDISNSFLQDILCPFAIGYHSHDEFNKKLLNDFDKYGKDLMYRVLQKCKARGFDEHPDIAPLLKALEVKCNEPTTPEQDQKN